MKTFRITNTARARGRASTRGRRVRPAQWLVMVALTLVLGACATPAPRDSGSVERDDEGVAEDGSPTRDEAERAPEPEHEPTPAAALNLAQQAESAREAGDTARAEQRLERALRIAPRDAQLWHQMAVIRMDQERYEQAERLASRSLQVAGSGDRELALKNWRLILAAREAQGDTAGAEEAREEIRRLESDVV